MRENPEKSERIRGNTRESGQIPRGYGMEYKRIRENPTEPEGIRVNMREPREMGRILKNPIECERNQGIQRRKKTQKSKK
mgnify:FL=1